MRLYCTLFDRNYLTRGLALQRSLERHGGAYRLYILCLDEVTREALSALALPNTGLVTLDELQKADPALAAARANRSPVEFYFTCKPVLMTHALAQHPGAPRVEYLDSDLYCFADPAPLEREYEASSVALSPHRFSAANAHLLQYGRYNAGWVSAAGTPEGRQFLAWWRERCLEWCRITVEETRFGDQKYLDAVPSLFPSARAVPHPGLNAGPWSISEREVSLADGRVRIDGEPLYFFHFHAMKRLPFNRYETGLFQFGARLTPAVRDGLYGPYAAELAAGAARLAALPDPLRAAVRPAPPSAGWRDVLRTVRNIARRTTIPAEA
ncbi:MAG TPA: hypothetical protein VG873_10195 [Burkholderiales bacterium]|nr:hypothetical protein [Burkholderiales bacterium]